jgi:hypothetical protein
MKKAKRKKISPSKKRELTKRKNERKSLHETDSSRSDISELEDGQLKESTILPKI